MFPATKLSALRFKPFWRSSTRGLTPHLANNEAQAGSQPNGGCLRGLMWAVLLEAAAVVFTAVLVHAWQTLHL